MIFKHLNFGFATSKLGITICSRKITNIITKREILNADEILKSEEDFIKLFKKLSPKYKESRILNTDQIRIEKEQYSRRTLSYKGE
jgi:hypothetical protein